MKRKNEQCHMSAVNTVTYKHTWIEGYGAIETDMGTMTTIAFRTPMIPGVAVTYAGMGIWTITAEHLGRNIPDAKFELLESAILAVEVNGEGIDWANIAINNVPKNIIEAGRAMAMDARDEADMLEMAIGWNLWQAMQPFVYLAH